MFTDGCGLLERGLGLLDDGLGLDEDGLGFDDETRGLWDTRCDTRDLDLSLISVFLLLAADTPPT